MQEFRGFWTHFHHLPSSSVVPDFVESVRRFWISDNSSEAKAKAIAALIHRIDVSPDSLKIQFYLGKSQINGGLPRRRGRPRLVSKDPSPLARDDKLDFGSNSLTNGGGGGDQTSV